MTPSNSAPTINILQLASLKQQLLSPRVRDAHKGLYGHVLILGGDYGMAGAPLLAGYAGLRIGVGKVSILTREEHTGFITGKRPELMCHGDSHPTEIRALIAKATTLVVGPGLGQTSWAQHLLSCALSSGLPCVVDADALNLLAQHPQKLANAILTPHVGEAARLLQTTTQKIQAARTNSVIALQDQYGGVVVLKGANSLICSEQTQVNQCQQGNPGMASPGMGDVLSGVIGGLLAQGLSLSDSAALGVCLHATAGDLAATQGGERGLLALDLMPFLRQLVN